jgi:hypothetical protein
MQQIFFPELFCVSTREGIELLLLFFRDLIFIRFVDVVDRPLVDIVIVVGVAFGPEGGNLFVCGLFWGYHESLRPPGQSCPAPSTLHSGEAASRSTPR